MTKKNQTNKYHCLAQVAKKLATCEADLEKAEDRAEVKTL